MLSNVDVFLTERVRVKSDNTETRPCPIIIHNDDFNLPFRPSQSHALPMDPKTSFLTNAKSQARTYPTVLPI